MMLGNMSVKDMEARAGVKFPDELIEYMNLRRQEHATNISADEWHCFDIPFYLLCGSQEVASEIFRHLGPLSAEFKTTLQIGTK